LYRKKRTKQDILKQNKRREQDNETTDIERQEILKLRRQIENYLHLRNKLEKTVEAITKGEIDIKSAQKDGIPIKILTEKLNIMKHEKENILN